MSDLVAGRSFSIAAVCRLISGHIQTVSRLATSSANEKYNLRSLCLEVYIFLMLNVD